MSDVDPFQWVDAQVIRTDPVIVLMRWSAQDNLIGPAREVGPMVRDRPATFLVWNPWCLDDWFAGEMARQVAEYRARVADHRFIFLCNEGSEVPRLTGRGLEAVHLGHNLFVDETVFRVHPDAEPCFDTVYNAQLTGYKRHELCAQLPSVLLITYFFNPDGPEVLERTRTRLPQATWANFTSMPPDEDAATLIATAYRRLDPSEVCRLHNRARAGLCLSEAEGQMFASIEYLMCGLPVVTTPNRGGRDRYFDPAHSIMVDPDPAAVLGGVRTLLARRLDREAIRSAALERINADRERLGQLVDELCRQGGGAPWSDAEHQLLVRRRNVISRLDLLLAAVSGAST